MTSWIEPPPKRKGMGCFGKGCLLIIVLLVLLAVAFFIGFYTGHKADGNSPGGNFGGRTERRPRAVE